jgi:hypothetical protein
MSGGVHVGLLSNCWGALLAKTYFPTLTLNFIQAYYLQLNKTCVSWLFLPHGDFIDMKVNAVLTIE